VKRVVKATLHPVSRRVAWRIQQRIDGSLGAVQLGIQGEFEFDRREIRALQLRVDTLEIGTKRVVDNHLPVVLERLAAHNADARSFARKAAGLEQQIAALTAATQELRDADTRQGETLQAISARGEFVRKEILHEFRHGSPVASNAEVAEPKILNSAALDATPLRVNLGCGHIALPGYVNCDARPLDKVDVVADVSRLPFAEGSVDEIFSAHLLEHFPQERLKRSLLRYWRSLLRPGGTFRAIVPDADTMLAETAAGRMTFDDFRLVTFGEQEYDGDFHFTMFSQAGLRSLLEDAGFVDVKTLVAGRRNGACYEMEVEARVPETDDSN
jgi:SAM-dependent methyltransferase